LSRDRSSGYREPNLTLIAFREGLGQDFRRGHHEAVAAREGCNASTATAALPCAPHLGRERVDGVNRQARYHNATGAATTSQIILESSEYYPRPTQ